MVKLVDLKLDDITRYELLEDGNMSPHSSGEYMKTSDVLNTSLHLVRMIETYKIRYVLDLLYGFNDRMKRTCGDCLYYHGSNKYGTCKKKNIFVNFEEFLGCYERRDE